MFYNVCNNKVAVIIKWSGFVIKRQRIKKIMECKRIIYEIKKEIPERSIENAVKIAKKIIASLGIKSFPIPIVKILREIGFDVRVADIFEENISGFILIGQVVQDISGKDKAIGVSKYDSVERQRFTLAHEFAHYLFDFNENEDVEFFSTYDIEKADTDDEKIPSRFAAEFLMPEEMFIKRYKELEDLTRYEKINQLSQDFKSSQKSVIIRFEELGLE